MKFTKLSVSKKEVFKVAHEITKDTVRKGDNYRVTFAAVLKEIYIAVNDLSSEYAAKSIKSRLSCFFQKSAVIASFSGKVLDVYSEFENTIHSMNEAQIEAEFKKLSLSVINSIWDYMPFN